MFLENNLEKSHMYFNLSDDSNTKIHTKKLAPPLKCEYENKMGNPFVLKTHLGKDSIKNPSSFYY